MWDTYTSTRSTFTPQGSVASSRWVWKDMDSIKFDLMCFLYHYSVQKLYPIFLSVMRTNRQMSRLWMRRQLKKNDFVLLSSILLSWRKKVYLKTDIETGWPWSWSPRAEPSVVQFYQNCLRKGGFFMLASSYVFSC